MFGYCDTGQPRSAGSFSKALSKFNTEQALYEIGEEMVEVFEEIKGELNLGDDNKLYYVLEKRIGKAPDEKEKGQGS